MTEPKFIGQGTYGCIYKPIIPCLNTHPTNIKGKGKNKKYISKLQINQVDSEREFKLGKIIMEKIKKYNTMFAPIIESCPIDIKVINQTELEKCDLITKNIETGKKSEFKAYKMQYAGKQSLGNYLLSLLSSSPKKIIKQMIKTHIYLLKSLDKLSKLTPPFIHYDLKDNNIMYDEKLNIPIIIDFGLSFELNPEKEYNNTIAYDQYYVFYEKYPPWCIELVLLSYIVQKIINNKINNQNISEKIQETDIENLKNICNIFISENDVYKNILEEEKTIYKQKLHEFISSYLKKSWETLFKDLQKSYASWDNYSLSVIYLFYIKDLISKVSNVILDDYNIILKKIILGVPNNTGEQYRPSITETIEYLKKIATSVNKKQYNKLLTDIKSSINIQSININLNKTILNNELRI